MRGSLADRLFVSLALALAVAGSSLAAEVRIDLREDIGVSDAPGTFPPVAIDVVETVPVADAPGAIPPVEIFVQEKIVVMEQPTSAPPISISVVESVGVADGPRAFPPVSIDIGEGIGVADGPSVFPPASISVVEGISVKDGAGLAPPVPVDVAESIAVADLAAVFPPVSIGVVEGIAVADGVVAVPPGTISLVEGIAVADVIRVFAPLSIGVVETIAVDDVPLAMPPVSISVQEAITGSDLVSVSVPDTDGDGVADSVEDAAPNGGDGNGDGTPDREQGDVASLPAGAGGQAVTLELAPGCGTLTNVEAVAESSLPADPIHDYPQGLVRFLAPCDALTLTTLWHGTASLPGPWRQYGPVVPGSPGTADWYTLGSASFGTRAVAGVPTATATIDLTDGDVGDDTGLDGSIAATGGPALALAPHIPALYGVAGVLLAVVLLAVGVRFTIVSTPR